jgi:hypothetical protein
MVQNQGIDVYLAPFSDQTKPYPQHGIPVISPNFTGDPNEVYIQAVDSERFVILVDFMQDFNMYGAEHVKIKWEIDQDRGANGCSDYRSGTFPNAHARYVPPSQAPARRSRPTALNVAPTGPADIKPRVARVQTDWIRGRPNRLKETQRRRAALAEVQRETRKED